MRGMQGEELPSEAADFAAQYDGARDCRRRRLRQRDKKVMKESLKNLLHLTLFLTAVLLATYLLIHFVGQRTEVFGHSMEPTLDNGDQLIVDKLSYRFRDPERYDIIVFPFKYQEKTYYIKRIIGLPGETVRIDEDGTIWINGTALDEQYGKETILDPGPFFADDGEVQLGEDEYFVLGDNRNNSQDSRDPAVGVIHRGDIIGRTFIRIYPFDRFGILKHQ